jgi:hypothetical protein
MNAILTKPQNCPINGVHLKHPLLQKKAKVKPLKLPQAKLGVACGSHAM